MGTVAGLSTPIICCIIDYILIKSTITWHLVMSIIIFSASITMYIKNSEKKKMNENAILITSVENKLGYIIAKILLEKNNYVIIFGFKIQVIKKLYKNSKKKPKIFLINP